MTLMRYQEPELAVHSPLDQLAGLREEMNRLFEGTFGRETGIMGGWSPSLDIHQDKDNLCVHIELPGMKKEDIDISLHNGMLTIAGERKQEETVSEGEVFRSERYFGRFHRTISLPAEVDASNVKATYKDGILTVLLPKSEAAKPKQIEVKVD